MAVVSQKDIVKIIKSSVNNIQIIIDTMAKHITKVTENGNTGLVKNNINAFKEICNFLNEYIKTINVVIQSTPVMNFPRIRVLLALNAIKGVMKIMTSFIESLSNKQFDALDNKKTTARIAQIKKIISDISTIFSGVAGMIKYSVFIVAFGWMIRLAIRAVIKIIKLIVNLTEVSVPKKTADTFSRFKSIIDGMLSIMGKLILMIPLALPAIIGAMVASVFIFALCGIILVVGLLLRTMKIINKKVVKDIRSIRNIFIALIVVGFAILALALLAPIVIMVLAKVVMPFIVLLLLCIVILALALFLINKLSKFAKKQTIQIAINLLLIVAIFVVICLAIFIAGVAGAIILKENSLWNIIVGFIGIGVVLAVIILVGVILDKAKKSLTGLNTVIVPLLYIIGMLALIAVGIIGLGELGRQLIEGDLALNAALGLAAVIVVTQVIVLVGKKLSESIKDMLQVDVSITILVATIGLMVVAGLAIYPLAKLGEDIKQGNMALNALIGIGAVIAVALAIMGVGFVLSKVMKHITETITSITPLLIVLGLMVIAGLAIYPLAKLGEDIKQGNMALNALIGIGAVIAVALAIMGVGFVLSKVMKHITETITSITPLLIVLGLMVVAGLAIYPLAKLGEDVKEGDMALNALIGIGAVIAVATIIVAIGFVLSKVMQHITMTTAAIIPLVIVIGLMVIAGLAVYPLAKLGEDVKQGNMALNALIGIGAVIAVALAIMGVGIVLTFAMALITLTSVAIIPLVIALGFMLLAGITIQEFAKINLGKDVVSTVKTNINAISEIGWQLAWLGLQMVLIGTGCGLLLLFITPFLLALKVVSTAVKATEYVSNAEIDSTNISKNLKAVSDFWDEFKNFTDKFSVADLFLLSQARTIAYLVRGITCAVMGITTMLSKISEISLDGTQIKTKVGEVFDIIKELQIKIHEMLHGKDENGNPLSQEMFEVPKGGFLAMLRGKTKMSVAGKLNRVQRIVKILNNITRVLSDIQNIKLEKQDLLDNVDAIFSIIDELQTRISTSLSGTTVFDDTIEKAHWWSKKKKVKNESLTRLDKVSQVICVLQNITDGLYSIQKINLNYEQNIKSKVDDIFKFIGELSGHISTSLSGASVFDDTIEQAHWWNKKKKVKNESLTRLDKVSQVITVLSNITESLKSIQSITVNKQKIKDNVEFIFGFVTELGTFIKNNMSTFSALDDKVKYKWVEGGLFKKGYWEEDGVEKNTTVDRISDIDKIISSLGNIMSSLDAISKVKLTEDVKSTINTNIESMFKYISELTLKVNNLLNPKESILNAETNVLEANVNYAMEKSVADVLNDDKITGYADKLGAVGNVVNTLSDILESINKIKDIKIKESDKTKVQQNIELLFGTVVTIVDETNKNIESLEDKSINSEALDPIVNGLQSLNTAFENLGNVDVSNFKKNSDTFAKFISKIATTEIDKDKASIICGTVDSIAVMITKSTGTNILEANSRLTLIERLNTAIGNFNNINEASINRGKRALEGYTKFVEKINTIDIKKLETSAKIFEEMAKFSKHIKGNFDALAESINEDLMPVLKELKEIMEKVPETLETGFQNTNASIGAVNAPPTSENLSSQVKRENPTLTAADVDRIVRQRLNAIAKNNDDSKLDNIIKILQGIGSYSGVKIQPQTY